MVDEGRLSEEDAEQLMKLLFAAGFDTTVGSIASMIRAFADNPDQWKLLKSNPDLVAPAVEEVIRYYPSVRYTGRVAAVENVVDGMLVPEGALVMMMWLAAGRDPRFWNNPDTFDITRERLAETHMSFGVGIHACLGQHVARMETQAVLRAMLRHVESIELIGPVAVADNMQGFSHTSVPVRIVPVHG
jgi:cytochrome P450